MGSVIFLLMIAVSGAAVLFWMETPSGKKWLANH